MNLRVVRKKIKSIKNVRKITKAMQMVSAVKMKKAQAAEGESRPYRDGISELIKKLSGDSALAESALGSIDLRGATRELIILVSSNKGLAGGFNMNLIRYLLSHALITPQTDFIIVGQKGAQLISRIEGGSILANFVSHTPTSESSAIFQLAMTQFRTTQYRSVSIIYNRFISTMRSEVTVEHILPLTHLSQSRTHADSPPSHSKQGEHLVEPSAQAIIENLILSYLEQKIRGAIISSEAVEHSARMMAMKSATDNAGELVSEMTLLANRLRQEKITYELLDMITAKESVGA